MWIQFRSEVLMLQNSSIIAQLKHFKEIAGSDINLHHKYLEAKIHSFR